MKITPVGFNSSDTWAVTNLTTNGSEFFTSSTDNTATKKYVWSENIAPLCPRVKVV